MRVTCQLYVIIAIFAPIVFLLGLAKHVPNEAHFRFGQAAAPPHRPGAQQHL